MDRWADSVGRRIQVLRRRAGLSQQELSAAAQLSLSGLRDLEQCRVTHPRAATLRRLATVLGLSSLEASELIRLGQEDSPLTRDLQIGVLGPLAITVDGAAVDLGSEPQRVLLGMLALSPGVPVRVESLVERVWGRRPPPNAAELVRSQISRLRRKLRSARAPARTSGVLVAAGGGYLLSVHHTQLDHLVFQRLTDQARRERGAGRLPAAFSSYQRAVELWRGNPFDDLPALRSEPVVGSLARQRQAVALEFADTARLLRRDDDVLPILHRLAEDNPLHELAHARLMTALAGSGRQAEALRVYTRVRDRLADDLGLDPVAELRAAHQAISHTEPPVPATHSLPAGPCGFAGRERELAALDTVRTGTAVITGTAGAGKTALAVHWARRAAGDFPDGQLYADLGGFGPSDGPARPADILRGFLEELGVPGDRIPDRPADRVDLYRHRLAGRRLVVVLDNALDVGQVRTLLPDPATCLAVVTSRRRLPELAADPLVLDVMSPTDACALLMRRLGRERVSAEPDAVAALVERCAGLPVALAAAAAAAATRPALRLTAFAEQLLPHTALDTLQLDDAVTDPRTVFSWSYRALGPDAARLFVRLGTSPWPEFDLDTALARAGGPAERVCSALDELCAEHLVGPLPHRRYRMHALLRAYATELASAHWRADVLSA